MRTFLFPSGVIPLPEAVQVVTIRAVSTESLLVKQALDTTSEAHLVGTILGTDGPAHPAMPAAAKQHDRSARDTCSHQTKRP